MLTDPRTTTASQQDGVVFVIGMRVNRWRSVRKWLPVFAAMPPMLRELARQDLGLLDARTYVSGRVVMVLQYWRSFDELERYARAQDHEHLPAWKAFNRRMHASTVVGIYHETYLTTAASREAISAHMPPHGLIKALGANSLTAQSRARTRLTAPAV